MTAIRGWQDSLSESEPVATYHNWADVQQELLTDDEIAESDQRAQRLLAEVNACRPDRGTRDEPGQPDQQ
jgi:hypothetical protein